MTAPVEDNKQPEAIPQEQTTEQKPLEQTNETKTTTEQEEDPNWRSFREARKRDKEERRAAEERAAQKEAEVAAYKAAMEAAFAQRDNNTYHQQSMDQVEETEEQRIERKVAAALDKQRQKEEQQRKAREAAELPSRIKKAMPDFDHVTSEENIDYLEYHHPKVAKMLNSLPDGYDKWEHVYDMVKQYVPNAQRSKKEAERAEQNLRKPQSISSTGVSPTPPSGRESQYTIEQRRAQRWEEMQKIMKGI